MLYGMFTYIYLIVKAVWVLLRYFFHAVVLQRPVSYPGDAKSKPLLRRGKWRNKHTSLPYNWKFASDKESHDVTNKNFPNHPLTGESAGRQIWFAEESVDASNPTFNAANNPNSGDKLFREIQLEKWNGDIPDEHYTPKSARETAIKGVSFYQMLQCDDGHWAGDYGGPMFLMPGLIIVLYLTKAPFPEYRRQGMIAYLLNHQQEDGGWGTHIECASTMFGTVLSYVSLRLLGLSSNHEAVVAAREFMHTHGGALYAPSWAKFWLAILGVYHWDGINSIPAEMWFLPEWMPFHPGKLWCHCRMVYLPMCYIYCQRYQAPHGDVLLQQLRQELYLEKYDTIDWNSYRQTCADIDTYSPLNPFLQIAQDFLAVYERVLPSVPFLKSLRQKALNFVIDYIHAEDIQTNFIDIGPVNKSLNMFSTFIYCSENSDHEYMQRHFARVDDYLWVAEDGMKMQGYNGSQCWDTSFFVQALVESDYASVFPECSKKIYSYLDRTQIKENEVDKEKYYRHESKGGWPFSTAAHGWPISDCTSEGLKGVLALHDGKLLNLIPESGRISKDRLCDAVNVILTLHNADGGWATYENNRGYGWYELLNPSEVFGDIMIDYSYVECTSACITALQAFAKYYPEHRANEILAAIDAGRSFILSIQRRDGSWYGSWGVCFTYATWFGIEGLVAAGMSPLEEPIQRAMTFLLSKQNPNGGWGESYVACVDKYYPADGAGEFGEDSSGVVQTAWALLGLLAGNCQNVEAMDRAVKYLQRKQLPNGDWQQEGITGVFNRSCGITYTAYRNVFPIWALGRYSKKFELR